MSKPGPLALFALGLVAGCSPQKAPTDRSVLTARINADIMSSDPGTRRDLNTDAVLFHVVEGLVAAREDGSVGPMLATGWTISSDGRIYRIALRRDVHFHNGAPLTSREVVWSFNHYLDKETRWRCRSEFGPKGIAAIESIAAPDAHTVVITLDHAAPMFLKTLTRADCGGTGILHPSSVGPDGKWQAPVGTGPFQWGEWRRNQFIELRRFEGYRSLAGEPDGNAGGKKALVERVRFLVIPDGSAASAALLRGSLDVVDGLSANEYGMMRGMSGTRALSSRGADVFAILFQDKDPTLRDPRMRRAIALSLDVAALTRVASHGTGTPNSSAIPGTSPYYSTVQSDPIRRNLAAARRLAKAAGYHGQPIALITSHSPPETYDIAILAQAMARDAGINLQLVTLDWASQFARYAAGDYQAMVFQYSPRLDPSLMFNTFTGDRATDPRKVWGSPLALTLLRRSTATEDGPVRQGIFDDMERAFRAETPAVILYNSGRITALSSKVVGYRPWQAELQRLWNVRLEDR